MAMPHASKFADLPTIVIYGEAITGKQLQYMVVKSSCKIMGAKESEDVRVANRKEIC